MPDCRPGRRSFRRLTASACIALFTLTACGSTSESNGIIADASIVDADGMNGAVLTEPYVLPQGTLLDSHGEAFDVRGELSAPLTLVFFGYTKCPDICQAVMADITSSLTRLEVAEVDQIDMWFVTTDPARDDSATLRAYLDRFNPEFEGLTGPLADIIEVADGVHIPIEKGERLPSGGYEVTHGTAILGVEPDGSVPILWTEGTSAAKLAEDFHTILTTGLPTVADLAEEN